MTDNVNSEKKNDNPARILAGARIKAFLATTRPIESKFFYAEVLGLKLLSEDTYALEFDCYGTHLRITAVPQFKPHPFTVLGWNVQDIKAVVGELNKKGVQCERFNFLQQDEIGVWNAPAGSKVAWFKDPDGNVLSLTE